MSEIEVTYDLTLSFLNTFRRVFVEEILVQ